MPRPGCTTESKEGFKARSGKILSVFRRGKPKPATSRDTPGPASAPLNQELIFHAALAIHSPAKRARFLERACDGEPLLQRKVAALLHVGAAADDFFEPGESALDSP